MAASTFMVVQSTPVVVSVEMGYGHLRAALPLVDALGAELLHADRAPLAEPQEQKLWNWVRRGHEVMSRPSQLGDLSKLMDSVTSIPSLYARRDLTRPTLGARVLDALVTRGLGDGLVERLRSTGAPLVTTFYAPAIIADRAGLEHVYCVVTDADINRVWVPMQGKRSRIRYFAPSLRVVRRLQRYGVPRERITMTGFPLPTELLGGPELPKLRQKVAERLVRLDPGGVFRELHGFDVQRALGSLPVEQEGKPARLVFAVGGAGAQAEMAFDFLPSLRSSIIGKHLEVTLVAGVRPDVAATFARAAARARLDIGDDTGLSILCAQDFLTYYRQFNQLLAESDILWTKPSELSFYAGLGIALVLAKPVGAHERYNRRFLREQGVALKQDSPRHTAMWLEEWLQDGTLAAAAWTGFVRMPKDGTHRIVTEIRRATSRTAPAPPPHIAALS